MKLLKKIILLLEMAFMWIVLRKIPLFMESGIELFFGDEFAPFGLKILLPIGVFVQLWRTYINDSEIKDENMRISLFEGIKRSITRCIVVIFVKFAFFGTLSLVCGVVGTILEEYVDRIIDSTSLIVTLISGIFVIGLIILFAIGCLYLIPNFIISTTQKICKLPQKNKLKTLNDNHNLEKEQMLQKYEMQKESMKRQYALDRDTHLRNYETKSRELDERFKKEIINLKRYHNQVEFKSWETTGNIEQYNDRNNEVVLYNNIGAKNENINNFVFYGSNSDKADYFIKLQNYIKREYNADSIKDLIDIPAMNTIDRMYALMKSTDDINYDMCMFFKNNLIYKDIYKITSLKESIKTYLLYRDKHVRGLSMVSNIGKIGEDSVNSYLEVYDDEIINLNNIRLEVEGNSIENDNILITRYGIFVVEVKNIGSTGSYSIEIEKDGRWLKRYNDNRTEIIEGNATTQNDRHVAYLQKFINKKLNRTTDNYIKVNGIVAIANNKISIRNNSNQAVYRTSEIYRNISQNDVVFSRKQMEIISNIIQSENCPPIRYPMVDFTKELKHNMSLLHKTVASIDLAYLSKLEQIITEYICNKNDLDRLKEDIINSLDSRHKQDIYNLDSSKNSKIRQMDLDLRKEIKNIV